LATEEIKRLSAELTDLIASTTQGLDTLNSNIAALETRQTITDAQWEALNAQRTALGTAPLIIRRRAALTETFNTASIEVKNAYALVFRRIQSGIEELADNAIATKNRVNELAKKRQGPPDNQG
jgi:phage shock protein A